MLIKIVKTAFSWIAYECNRLMSWAYEGYTTMKPVWIAASKAFSNSSNNLNTLGESNLKEHVLTKKLSRK